ncbi:MAG: DUF21 domain-containing protein [Clostridia bacterium]|nr:DUF21 domain-containing protein [Clostridia bacterium]
MNKEKSNRTEKSSEKETSSVPRPAERFEKKSKKQNQKIWGIKVTVLTFLLTVVFTFLSDIAVGNSTLVVAILIVLLLVVVNILFDAVAIAVTSCDVAPLSAMSARKVPGSKTALNLVKNANKVSSICADVIGDICGIVSGACGIVIVSKIMEATTTFSESLLTVLVSSVVAAMTVGGKAFCKKLAMTHSKELVMFTAKILSFFGVGKRNK